MPERRLKKRVSFRIFRKAASSEERLLIGSSSSPESLPKSSYPGSTESLASIILPPLVNGHEGRTGPTTMPTRWEPPLPPPNRPLPALPIHPALRPPMASVPDKTKRIPHRLRPIPENAIPSTFSIASMGQWPHNEVIHTALQTLDEAPSVLSATSSPAASLSDFNPRPASQPSGTVIKALKIPKDGSKPTVICMNTFYAAEVDTNHSYWSPPVGLRRHSPSGSFLYQKFQRVNVVEPIAGMRKKDLDTSTPVVQAAGSQVKWKEYEKYKSKLDAKDGKSGDQQEDQYMGGLGDIELSRHNVEKKKKDRVPKKKKQKVVEHGDAGEDAAALQEMAARVLDGYDQPVNLWYWYDGELNCDNAYSILVKLHPEEKSDDGRPVFEDVPWNWFRSRLIWDYLMVQQPELAWNIKTWGLLPTPIIVKDNLA